MSDLHSVHHCVDSHQTSHFPPLHPGLLIKLLLIIHVGSFVFRKTSIIVYYQVGGVTPLSSVSAMSDSQFSASGGHILLYCAHVDGCCSVLFCPPFFVRSGNGHFIFPSESSDGYFISVHAPSICSSVLPACKTRLRHVSVWPQMASVQRHLGAGAHSSLVCSLY